MYLLLLNGIHVVIDLSQYVDHCSKLVFMLRTLFQKQPVATLFRTKMHYHGRGDHWQFTYLIFYLHFKIMCGVSGYMQQLNNLIK